MPELGIAEELSAWPVWLFAGGVTLLCVVLHYETIRLLMAHVRHRRLGSRRVLLVSVLALLGVHLIEVALFAGAYMALEAIWGEAVGQLVGDHDGSVHDALYFSSAAYTTLGFGDIIPAGPLRMLVGIEALVGLVMIAWSASATFLLMQSCFSKVNSATD